jgi:hypothetical protein
MSFGSDAVRRLRRNQKGSVYIELVAALVLLSSLFIGSAFVGSKLLDFNRDTRAAQSGVDIAWVLDSETTGGPAQADLDIIGQKMLDVAGVDPEEDFQIYFTVLEYDHTGAGLQVDWTGSYGTRTALESRVSVSGTLVTVNGYDLSVADDERLVIAEFYRTRRGLFIDLDTPVYSYALSYKEDPEHA